MVSYVRGRGARTFSDAEIVAAYEAGEDSASIGARANCDAATVLYLVRRSGGTVRPRGTRPRVKVLPLTDAEIVQIYCHEGLSGTVIADRCGVTPATIYSLLHRHGVVMRPAAHVAKATAAAARARKRIRT
jgi:hypothetical protein